MESILCGVAEAAYNMRAAAFDQSRFQTFVWRYVAENSE